MKMSSSLKRTLLLSFVGLYVAGITYWLTHLFLRHPGEFGEEPHLLERLSGPLHLIAAFVFVFVIGIIWAQHIQPALRTNRRSFTGWIFLGGVGILATSGIVILYGTETLIKFGEKWHPILGASLLPLLVIHWKARKSALRTAL